MLVPSIRVPSTYRPEAARDVVAHGVPQRPSAKSAGAAAQAGRKVRQRGLHSSTRLGMDACGPRTAARALTQIRPEVSPTSGSRCGASVDGWLGEEPRT
jgi:hypothetical protein